LQARQKQAVGTRNFYHQLILRRLKAASSKSKQLKQDDSLLNTMYLYLTLRY